MLQPTDMPNLRILTSGPMPPNPAEVLNSAQMFAIVNQLKACSDMVIFDSPPVLAVSDAVILSGKLNSTMLIIDSGKTRTESAKRALENLNKVNAKVVGVVLNKMAKRRAESYYYYYQYYTPTHERAAKRRIFGRNGHAKVGARRETSDEKTEALR